MGIRKRANRWLAKKIVNFLQYGNDESPFLILSNNKVKSGKDSYHNGNMIVKGKGNLVVGNYCALGQDIKFVLSNHTYEYPSLQYSFYIKFFNEFPYKKKEGSIVIGSDVWIGDNAILLPNITVGNGAIIGAGAIVTKDVPDFAIVGGNPAKILKYRYTDSQIKNINESSWWNWSDEEIVKNREFFFTTPV